QSTSSTRLQSPRALRSSSACAHLRHGSPLARRFLTIVTCMAEELSSETATRKSRSGPARRPHVEESTRRQYGEAGPWPLSASTWFRTSCAPGATSGRAASSKRSTHSAGTATPPEGVHLREQLRKKYGGDPEAMFGRVEAAAHETGIPLDFAKVRRMVSTIGAHTLLRHAAPRGTQRALATALFAAYFLDGRDLGQPAVLASLAGSHGFATDEAISLIGDASERRRTREDADESERRGVEG